ncbi:HAMP domain-containing sensor histidine kinase [uncultured Paludibaculum sp.]|uniref:sensor histidine kinase n=1 Tax=uncultured Paludibaculum sp. TaxID=1765020 RepID=UPI002AAB2EB8|nr:HAMP domain-containing sensor histidine kinase [uncultured Paludibaculum sp.]
MSGSNSMRLDPEGTQPIGGGPGIPAKVMEPRPLTGISRRFGDLRVRPKLMVLHNSFFLILTCAVYFTVIHFVEVRMEQAKARELTLIFNSFSYLTPESGEQELRPYDLKTGTADDFGLTDEGRAWMARYPGRIWQHQPTSQHIYKTIAGTNRYYRLTLPLDFYSGMVASVAVGAFAVLGVIYILAVLVLELVIMPRYVYQPLRLLLEADRATREGDREAEIIDESFIPGDEIGQILLSHNVTVRELRKHEDDLERAKRNLEAQDRLVSLGLLSASVAHEMNTPLAVLHGSIEKLIETVDDGPAQARLARMVRVTSRLRRISESLLDFARQRRQEMGPVELRPAVDEAWQLVAIDEKAGAVQFTNAIGEGAAVVGNADRLNQVFVNLLRNALNAVPDCGGVIRAACRPHHIDGGPAFSITVDDNGPGIPAEILPDIFEAFVSTRLDSWGTGLGLTVAEGIVHQHGGTITASNCTSGGARLEVCLPAAPGDGEQRESAKQ